MNFFVAVLLSIIISSVPAYAFHNTFTASKDLTYDGEPEQIVYEVYGKDWEQPVSWSFTVYNGGRKIFRHAVLYDDNRLHYDDAGCVENCTGLVACRKEWFLHQAFPAMIVTVAPDEIERRDTLVAVYQRQAPDFYRTQLGLSENDAHSSVDRLATFLESREITGFCLPKHPAEFGALMVYDRFQQQFVRFYHP